MPAGGVDFFFLDESLLAVDLLLALLDDLLLAVLLDEDFFEVVFELEDFFLVVDFFELVAFGVEDLLDDFLEDFCFVFGFDLGGDCATAEDAKQIASKMARRVLITKLRFFLEGENCRSNTTLIFIHSLINNQVNSARVHVSSSQRPAQFNTAWIPATNAKKCSD